MNDLLFYLSPVVAGLVAAGIVIGVLERRDIAQWYRRPMERINQTEQAVAEKNGAQFYGKESQ